MFESLLLALPPVTPLVRYADSAGAFHMAVEDARAQLMSAAVGVDARQLESNLIRALAVG